MKLIELFLISAVILLVPSGIKAQEEQSAYLTFPLASWHVGSRSNGKDYNEKNYGIGYMETLPRKKEKWNRAWGFGVYKDSLGNWAGYAMVSKHYRLSKWVSAGFAYGLSSRKDMLDRTPIPVSIPSLTISPAAGSKRFKVILWHVPTKVTGMQIAWQIK